MSEKLLVFRIATTYVGTVIGAGFASGQEIVQFFTHFGLSSFTGIILATVFFACFGVLILYYAQKSSSFSYGQLLIYLCGDKIGKILEFFITIFLLGGLCVMIAGGGAIFAEHLYLSHSIGVCLTGLLVILVVFYGLEGVMIVNAFIVPIMVIVTLIVTFFTLLTKNFSTFYIPANHSSWLFSALLYVSYNMTLAIGVLAPLGANKCSKKSLLGGGLLGGALLGILILANNTSLALYYPSVLNYQVPMLYIAGHYGFLLYYLYIFVLWLEMITTAIGNTYALAKRLESFLPFSYNFIVLGCVFFTIPCSYLGFASLISWLYPLFGYFSLLFLFFLLSKNFRQGKGLK